MAVWWMGVGGAALPVMAQPQSAGPVSAATSGPATAGPATAGTKLAQWKQREAGILRVVETATDAVVAITDDESYGSGVIVSPDGLVLTAGHVIMSEAAEFTVFLPNGRNAVAKPLGKNLNQDAGMLQIVEPGPWPYVELADGRSLKRGDWVVTLGHSGGYDLGRRPPVRVGRVVRLERDAVTSDSPIIGGDSGGPVFNLDGQLVGIHSSIGESIAENRHVSIQVFLRDWDRLKQGESWGALPGMEADSEARPRPDGAGEPPSPRRGSPNRGRTPEDRSPDNRSDPGDQPPSGPVGSAVLGVEMDLNDSLPVLRVIKPGSAAQRVGLRVGDVVESFNGVAIGSPEELVRLIATKRAGDSVKMAIRRGEERIMYQIILGQLDTR
jgi:serine protease Do